MKLDDIPKKQFPFEEPDPEYFDRLSGRIQAKKNAHTRKSFYGRFWTLTAKLGAPALTAVVLLWFFIPFLRTPAEPGSETAKLNISSVKLNEVSEDQIADYLMDSGLSEDEILAFIETEDINASFADPELSEIDISALESELEVGDLEDLL